MNKSCSYLEGDTDMVERNSEASRGRKVFSNSQLPYEAGLVSSFMLSVWVHELLLSFNHPNAGRLVVSTSPWKVQTGIISD